MINYKCTDGNDCNPVLRLPYLCSLSGFVMLTGRRFAKCDRVYQVTNDEKLKYN